MQNSSFVLDDLNQDSTLVTERAGANQKPAGTQMSGGLMISTLN